MFLPMINHLEMTPLCSTSSRAIEREKQSITLERDRQNVTIRSLEDSLHEMEKQELGLSNRLHGKEVLEESIAKMRKEVTSFTDFIKVSVS